MPVIKSAKKKLRQDKKRQEQNKVQKDFLKKVVKTFRAHPTDKNLQAVYKATDKSVKKHLIHANKAARLKSSLTKTLSGKTSKAPTKQTEVKEVVKKTIKKPSKSSK